MCTTLAQDHTQVGLCLSTVQTLVLQPGRSFKRQAQPGLLISCPAGIYHLQTTVKLLRTCSECSGDQHSHTHRYSVDVQGQPLSPMSLLQSHSLVLLHRCSGTALYHRSYSTQHCRRGQGTVLPTEPAHLHVAQPFNNVFLGRFLLRSPGLGQDTGLCPG